MTWDGGTGGASGKEAKPVSLKDHTAHIGRTNSGEKKLFYFMLKMSAFKHFKKAYL